MKAIVSVMSGSWIESSGREVIGMHHQLWEMRDKSDNTDVTFLIGPEKTKVVAHKLVLLTASEVFRAMLSGPMAEKGEIKIEDTNTEDFMTFLKFVYCSEVKLTSCRQAIELCYMAHQYNISKLFHHCIDVVNKNLQVGNFWHIMKLANLVENEKLKDRCFMILQFQTLEILNDTSFVEISKEELIFLLQQEDLNINLDEATLIDAVLKWANANNEDSLPIREVIGTEILKLLRFVILKPEVFAQKYVTSGLLTDTEIIAIFANIFGAITHPLPDTISGTTNIRNIDCMNDKNGFLWLNLHPIRLEHTFSISNNKPTICILAFRVSDPCWLLGLEFFSRLYEGQRDMEYYTENILFSVARKNTVFETKTILASVQVKEKCTNSKQQLLMFSEPVYIESNFQGFYEISAVLKDKGTYIQRMPQKNLAIACIDHALSLKLGPHSENAGYFKTLILHAPKINVNGK